MTIPQRFAHTGNNEIVAATLTASSVLTSDAIFRDIPTRAGGGRVELVGDYTGDNDATFDIEITSGAGATPRVSQSVFSGAGTGSLWAGEEWNASEVVTAGDVRFPTTRGDYQYVCTTGGTTGGTEPTWPTIKGETVADNSAVWETTELSAEVAAGTSSQEFTLELKDLGTDTTHAAYDLGLSQIQAQAAGTGGNSIYISVDESGLTLTATDYALLEEWSAGTEEQTGDQWDYGALPLKSDGSIPAGAPRIAFGSDPQVFRQYKIYEDDEWHYYLSPTPKRDLPRGTIVYDVTGGRSVTITDGVSPEAYTSIQTLYDLLEDIQSSSSLVEVVGPVIADTTPGGVGAVDLSLRTIPYALPTVNSGSSHVRGLESVSVGAGAVTEEVSVRCIDNTSLGSEIWSVTGAITGALDDAVTAVAYASTRLNFTIPRRLTSESGVTGDIDVVYAASSDTASPPPVCPDLMVLGAAATSKTITFVRQAVPSQNCACENTPYEGRLSEPCLGTEIPEGEVTISNTGLAARIEDLNLWYAGAVAGNTELNTRGELRSAINDIELAQQIRDIFTDGLNDIYGDEGVIHPDPWAASTAYALYDVVEPTTANGYRYRATVAGTSAASPEPTWPTTIGNTVVDNGVTWTCVTRTADSAWDDYFAAAQVDYQAVDALGAITELGALTAITTSLAVTAGTLYTALGITAPDIIKVFLCIKSGTTDASSLTDFLDPTEYGDAVYSGDAIFMFLGDNHMVSAEDINYTSAMPGEVGISRSITQFVKSYESEMDACRAYAGIDPKGDAGPTGGGCWQEKDEAYWWVDSGGYYLPVYDNTVYHSARRYYDADLDAKVITSTKEFAFVLKVACPNQLGVGDTITVSISNTSQDRTYQVGDEMRVPVVKASNRYLSGGVTGNDTHTWSVRGSVDGALTDYAVVDGSEVAYSAGGLKFTIYRGGVPNVLGDKWVFSAESGQFRWRKDSGAWSGAADIPSESSSMSDGLSASFLPGAAPSFVDGDLFPFTVKQPASPANLTAPGADRWAWQTSSGTLTAALGASKTIDLVVIAWHKIPSGATILLEGSTDGSTWPMSQAVTWAQSVIAVVLDPAWTATHLRLSATSATDGSIGWLWAGEALQLSVPASQCTQRRSWSLARGGGVSPSALFRAAGYGASVQWNMLSAADISSLLDMLDTVAEGGWEPFAFLPSVDNPSRVNIVRTSEDQVEVRDWSEFQRADGTIVGEAGLDLSPVFME